MNSRQRKIAEARAAFECASNAGEREAWDRLRELQRHERDTFANGRGWRVSPRAMHLKQLKAGKWVRAPYEAHDPELDHVEAFVSGPVRRPVPIALRTHSYASWQMCKAFAERHGLRAELLPFSSYMPNRTIAVLYTRPE
jgi:hypothetical protein